MATFKPTPSQQQAIDDRGKNILVSASAGSGKTAVLVQRAIKLIKEGIHVDRMLMVTFTDAAAKSMRDKIRDALQEAVRQPAHNAEEQRQQRQMENEINRLATADISTIHAFCLKLIKHYYYLIHLDPQFRLLTDDTERLLLQEEIWQQVSEKLYESSTDQTAESQINFGELVTNFSSDRDAQGLDELVLKLYETANAQPEPEQWLNGLAENYFLGNNSITSTKFYQEQLKPVVKDKLKQLVSDYGELSLRMADLGYGKPAEIIKGDQTQIRGLIAVLDQEKWGEIRAAFKEIKYARMSGGAKKKDPEYETYQSLIKARNGLKDQLKSLVANYFEYDEQQFRKIADRSAQVLRELSAATIKFSRAYQQAKLNRHVLEFSDLEHYAYQILTPPADQPDWSTLVDELRNHYQEIMIDEYQDTNPLQEKILMKLTSPERHNLFMVGDVKQSIYRFREADPSLFLTKYQHYRKGKGGESIVLAENFRSMSNVTGFTNLLFEQLMDRQVGEIDYDKDAHLKYAATYYDENPDNKIKPAEVLLYDANVDPKKPQEDDKLTGELRMVAMRIKQMVTNQELIYDKNSKQMRPVQYGDIVLLERTKNINNTLMEQFNELEVPLTVHDVESYFQATEVRVMMSLLKVIDNPKQDIPLVAVLRSPIVGLSNKELAFIRLQNRQTDFYTAMVTCHDNFEHHHLQQRSALTADQLTRLQQKLATFIEQLTEFRQVAQQQTLVDLIWRIYQETGYLDYVGAMPGGQQRQANLHALYERAHTYEQSSFKGLYQFTRFIEKMQEHDQDLGVAPTQLDTNTVNVMTIHGSKGLQFPVVFLINTNHHFNNSAVRENAVVDPDSGVGIKVMDEQRLVYDTPQRQVILNNIQQGERAEDLRVLYVALTRAEQRLIVTASFNESRKGQKLADAWNGWQKAFQSDQQLIGAQLRINAKSFMDWIGLALARYSKQFNAAKLSISGKTVEDAGVTLEPSPLDTGKKFAGMSSAPAFIAQTYTAEDVEQQLDAVTRPVNIAEEDSETVKTLSAEKINQILAFRYPHEVATETTAYQSVTDVKRVFEDPDNREMGQWDYDQQRKIKNRGLYLKNDFAVPQFIQQDDQSPAATEVGTATHLVFQKLPLNGEPIDDNKVHDEIKKLVQEHLISPAVAGHINVEGIAAFFQTALGQQIIKNNENYHREEPFAMIMNGHELFKEVQAKDDERILIHGIIDGYLETAEGIILVDYKTDHIDPNYREFELAKITDRYRGQLELYRQALNIMKPIPVVQMGLYLVELGEFIPFKIEGRP
ncbi:MAG: helicase-exonuclease AddAB subunit AddA [Limosilactobacillus sp.]|jgi:ATP-dependent helicase/nuclease subunit A|uniref:helicase-exonuclease AddAB subunit AddA n=1 Tax=Limosilactobacillus sp. TaxID=2773925 RepID=UPI0025BBBE68|nr:helicase-exonuclease AddAB subunit AddA [Limosilactobacillus sp.]MCI1974746.1 helicase-exonuclease AddAB subunit AddA [Limosilactobacillus sp.]MCI2030526.1 helicase-exonuclease AddAB subunit AddA [Limosilactobacillus sp.]